MAINGKKATLRGKIVFFGFICVVVCASVLFLVYTYFSVASTGYKEFQTEQAEAIKRVNALVNNPLLRIQAPPGVSDENPTTSSLPTAPLPAPLLDISQAPPTSEFFDKIGIGQYGLQIEVRGRRNLVPEYFDGQKPPAGARSIDSQLEQCLNMVRKNHSYTYITKFLNVQKSIFIENLVLLEPEWGKILERRENLIGNSLREPPPYYENFGYYKGFNQQKSQKIDGADERAARILLACAARKDPHKAARLLENYVKLLCARHQSYYPQGSSNSFYQLESLFLLLGQMEMLPEETFRRASATLAATVLDAEQIQDFRVARAMNERERLLNLLEESKIVYKDNLVGLLYWGSIEKTLNRFMLPMMRYHVDRLAVAQATDDKMTINQEREKMLWIGKVMNLEEHNGFFITPNKRPVFMTMPSASWEYTEAVGFNDEVNFARFILAASHYRHATGDFPRKVEDLIPQYLPPSFYPSTEETWVIQYLPAFHRMSSLIAGMEKQHSFTHPEESSPSWQLAEALLSEDEASSKKNALYRFMTNPQGDEWKIENMKSESIFLAIVQFKKENKKEYISSQDLKAYLPDGVNIDLFLDTHRIYEQAEDDYGETYLPKKVHSPRKFNIYALQAVAAKTGVGHQPYYLFRRAKGRWPKSVEEMKSFYAHEFDIETMRKGNLKPEDTEMALIMFQIEKNRAPLNHGELEPYFAPDVDMKALRKRFWCEARPVFFRISKTGGQGKYGVSYRCPNVILTSDEK